MTEAELLAELKQLARQQHEAQMETARLLGAAYGLLSVLAGPDLEDVPERQRPAVAKFFAEHEAWRQRVLG
jgi:hypothetical protein